MRDFPLDTFRPPASLHDCIALLLRCRCMEHLSMHEQVTGATAACALHSACEHEGC